MISEERCYPNAEIKKLLDKYVTEEKYHEFKPILDEIIQRRAFEFNLPINQVRIEIGYMVANIDKIVFAESEEFSGPTVAGVYKSNQKEISINKAVVKNIENYYAMLVDGIFDGERAEKMIKQATGKELFETLAHEVFHAITDFGNGIIGISHNYTWPGGMQSIEGVHLNEVITESAASRIVNNKKSEDIKQGFSKTLGYEHLTFITNMLANAIGVSEKELLKAGITNRKEFLDLYYSKFQNEDRVAAFNVLRSIENSIFYAVKTWKNIPNETKYQAEHIANIYNNLYRLAYLQVLSENKNITPELVGEIFYRNQKMTSIMVNSTNYFLQKGFISQEDVPLIADKIKDFRDRFHKQALDLNDVYNNKIPMGTDEYKYAQKGELGFYLKYFEPERYPTYEQRDWQTRDNEIINSPEIGYVKYLDKLRDDDFSQHVEWDKSVYFRCYDIFQIVRDENEKVQSCLQIDSKTLESISNGVCLFEPSEKER